MIGKTLGHYRILAKIGQGGMGEVFLADDTSLHRKVALKFLPPAMQWDPIARKRFIREARSAAALDHPYICHINEVAESEGQDFIVMEYVDGQSLKDRLVEGPPPLEDMLQITIEVTEALEAAHGKGIIHRDIKPANVMLTQTGHAKVMDFGLAKQVVPSGERESEDETITALTADGSAVGTLAYMSPEQLRGQAADGRSDIWALGVTLYEMAAGVRPFHGQSGFELTSAILHQAPRPLPSHVPAELGAVIERCLEKEPSKRYQKADKVRAALEAIQAGTVAPWVAWRYRLGRHPWLVLAAALTIILAILVGLDVGGLRRRLTGGGEARAVRLAVLPFENLTGDPEQEYLSDGMTQEMISQLGSLHPASLSVIARTSVMRYKKTDKPIDQIGRELRVDYVLEGSARREAGLIRVTAELIRAQDQTQLWSETYERERSGILALQSDVARKVAGSLALRLLPAEEARLTNVRAIDPDAYDAYLKGSQHWIKLSKADLEAAEGYFNLALRKEPDYAAAYAGIAWVWACRSQMSISSVAEAGPKMSAAALKAVALDDALGESHYALAAVKTWHDWDLPAAERHWKRAIELNPNYADALAMYSHFLMIVGRPEEAMLQIKRALELDPFSVMTQSFYAVVLVSSRRYDEAIVQAHKALQMQPRANVASGALYQALVARQSYAEALALDKEEFASDGELSAALARGYAEAGYPGSQKALASVLAKRLVTGGGAGVVGRVATSRATTVARRYLWGGDRDRGLEWLEKAYEAREPTMPYMCFPVYDVVRSDPRFQSLLRRMNLPQ